VQFDTPAKKWLNDRGITLAMVLRYRLGFTGKYLGNTRFVGISIPIPAGNDTYYQKVRMAPWLLAESVPMPWYQKGIPAQVWFTCKPENATETWFCEGEWDAIRLGYEVEQLQMTVAVACSTCGCDTVPPEAQLDRLPGEKVVIFYDRNDKPTKSGRIPGEEGAKKLAMALGNRGVIGKVPMPDDCEVKGWDVSNALDAGFEIGDFINAALKATPFKESKKDGMNPLRSHLVTTDELIARAPDYVEWLVNDLLTSNELFLLAAPPRGGKSLFAMGLSKAVATGSKFLDRPTMQGPVIYVNLEDADAKIKERAESQQWPEGIDVYWLDSFKLNQLQSLIEIIEEIGPRLVVLDTLSRVRSEGISESSAEIGLVLEPLQECAKRCNTCILIIHHTKKINVDEGDLLEAADSIRGSSAIRATCRGTMVIAPGKESYRLVAENGHGKHDLSVRLNPNTLEWNLLGKWSPVVNLDMKTKALDYLNKVTSATCEEIARETASPMKSLHVALSRLVADGVITKRGTRKAAVYERGIQHIQQLNSLLNSPNEDQESAKGPYSTKNTFSFLEEEVKTDENSALCNENVKQGDSAEKSFFVEYGGKTESTPYTASDTAIQQLFNNGKNVEYDSRPDSEAEREIKGFSDSLVFKKQPVEYESGDRVQQYFPKLPNGKKTDCRVLIGDKWITARYLSERGRMRMSPITKTLEIAHTVEVVDGPMSVKCIQVTESQLVRSEGSDNANG
jgi:hypothetical protein